MASLSLPRVLQLKKNSLDAEREQFEKFQTLAIQKAINSIETPVKEKHVRSTIIGTFQEQSAITYWMVAIRLPLQDNRIVSWKFCHVTHKLLREGHPACLDDSQRHINMIENLGKLWVHLREGYGKLVHLYCSLLVCKLRFHARNPRFPGNMQLTADELDAIAENDVNNYFQLCVELFDYMDDILNLQAAVFDSLGNARANSMTASGQCRLAALIPCAQDSSQIYDCNVRLLFRLHAALPQDTLAGHRDRFRQQFKKLSSFYKHASSLQYYRNLLTLPVLPSNPPNFLLQSDFGTYVAPVVSIPEPQPDEVDLVGSLIDTSDTISQVTFASNELESARASPSPTSSRSPPSPQPDPVVERDRLIEHLQNELKRMRSEVSQLVQERNSMLGSMREHCTRIESQLQSAKVELDEEKQKTIVLSAQTPEIKQKLTETEEKAKVTDEKFQKLKGAYTQLREEHIALIRQKAEVDKMTTNLRAAAAQHESAKTSLQQQLNDRMKDVELLQQSVSSSEEIEAYKSEISSLRNDLEQSRQKELELETLKASLEALEIEHKTASAEQQEKLTNAVNDLKEATENIEKVKSEKEEKESELTKVKEHLMGLQVKSGDELKKVVEEKELALKQVAELTQKHQQEKEELGRTVSNLQADVEIFQQQLNNALSTAGVQHDELVNYYQSKIEELTINLENKDTTLNEMTEKLNELQKDINKIKSDNDSQINKKTDVIEDLKVKVNELMQSIEDKKVIIGELETLNIETESKLNETINEKEKLIHLLNEKDNKISDYEIKIEHLSKNQCDSKTVFEELINTKNKDIQELKKQLEKVTDKKNSEICFLQETLLNKTEICDLQLSDIENHLKTISELECNINDKMNIITNLTKKFDDLTKSIEQQKHVFEDQLKDKQRDLTIFEDKIQNATSSKEEIISNLKTMITEKDKQVIQLNVEVNRLSRDVAKLEDDLQEAQAEIDIGQSELLTLKEEHEAIVDRNERNLVLKNKELRDLNEEVVKLTEKISELQSEKGSLLKVTSEKMVLETRLRELEESHKKLTIDYEISVKDAKEMKNSFRTKLDSASLEYEDFKDLKNNELNDLKISYENELKERDDVIIERKNEIEELRIQISELEKTKTNEINEVKSSLAEKLNESKILEVRLDHIEREKLNAECELQDLLQHNTVLEADLTAAKRKVEEMRMELEKERSRVLSCAGSAALEVTGAALAALERGRDALPAAADLAAAALEQIEAHTEVKGNEESLGKLLIAAAHNTAQLSSYVTEVFVTTTDADQHDKLSNECRELLEATRQCVSSVCGGAGAGGAGGAGERARALGSLAAAAAAGAAPRSVDDELADMDTAIEHAAKQIEELLAASRAGDSGVKLEVNGKILDACTTLMSAVKALVQDARRLQQELGDNKTRQKMYRNNPQWREGLISAAKAVVFAAKLLVSSADEAVGGTGRAEGVSAAAHEVAGSTAQLVAASRARAPPAAPALARLTQASRAVAAATGAVVAAVRSASSLLTEQESLDTSTLTLTATRILEMESKVRALELESALEAERARLAALRKRHYHLAQQEENGNMTNGKE